MEVLYFLKFWRPTTHKDNSPAIGNSDTTEIPSTLVETENEFDEGEDSFFELELTVPDFDTNKSDINNNISNNNNSGSMDYRFDSKEETVHNSADKACNGELKFPQPTISVAPSNVISKRKILPIEPISKPQSPIALLKSAPRFRVFMFRKSKSVAAQKTEKTGETELNGVFVDTLKQRSQENNLFAVKFRLGEHADVSVLTREKSLRNRISEDSIPDDSSKRFSKEAILNLIKPLYIKVSKWQSEKMKFSGEFSVVSRSSSPATLPAFSPLKKEKQGNNPAGIRVVCKHLGKSKSTSATTGVQPLTVRRRDDSLLLQHDGIQSAILHCKKSFNSSRDSTHLSTASPRMSSEENGLTQHLGFEE